MELTGNAESQFPKQPSFLKWLSGASEQAIKPLRIVNLIWLPNQYKSLTLETEVYRLRITDNSPLYEAILNCVPEWEEEGSVVAVRVDDRKTAKFSVVGMPDEQGLWESIGEFGRKITVQDKPSRKRRT